jgi:sugar lactone lactonase YvrE
MLSDAQQAGASPEENTEALPEPEVRPFALKTAVLTGAATGLLLGLTLALTFYLAPGLVTFLELTQGLYATTEITVRAHLLLLTAQWMLIFLFFLHVKPVHGLRERLILYFLLAAGAVLCAIWLFDNPEVYFRSEGSSLTFFSSVVLVLCAGGAFANLFMLRMKEGVRQLRMFWSLLSAAFLFAVVDEFFQIHERVAALTKINNFGQDLLTAAYAVGAIVVLAVYYKSFKNNLFSWRSWFFRLFLAATVILGAAMFFDAAGGVFQFFHGHVFDFNHLSNTIEELLEFTAACLFCCAFIINIAEADDGRILHKAEDRISPFHLPVYIKVTSGLAILCLIAVLVAIRSVFGGPDTGILPQEEYPVARIAGRQSGLDNPDGLLFHPEYGLIVCNEGSGSLTAFSPDGRYRPFVDSNRALVSPEGLAVGSGGLIVSDDSRNKLLLYTAPGADPVELYSDNLLSPEGLAVDQQGRLYIADEKLSMVIRQTGDQREILASSLDGLMTPEEMVFDDEGNLYVTDEAACAVFRISPDGGVSRFADEADGLCRPEGIAFHKGRLYVTDDLAGTVFRFDADGNGRCIMTFGPRYRRLSGITFDSEGLLYIVSRDPCSDNAWLLRIDLPERDPIAAFDPAADEPSRL